MQEKETFVCGICGDEKEVSEKIDRFSKEICGQCDDDYTSCDNCDSVVKCGEVADIGGDSLCDSCIRADFFSCCECGEYEHNDNERYVRGRGSVCENCSDDTYYCDNCSEYIESDDWNSDSGTCYSCSESYDGIQYREVNTKNTDGQCDEAGDVIKSLRTFGVELEMVNKESQKLAEVSKTLDSYVGVENDGSIGGGYGIEVQTPVLSGKKGEEKLKDILDKVKSAGFGVNKTCGTHIHLGAGDFLNEKRERLIIMDSEFNTNNRDMFAYTVFRKDHSKLLTRSSIVIGLNYGEKVVPTEIDLVPDLLVDIEENTQSFYNYKVSAESAKKIDDLIGAKKSDMVCKMIAGILDRGIYSELKFFIIVPNSTVKDTLFYAECAKARIFPFSTAFIEQVDSEESAEKLKTLMSFYVAFDDVILSMLSHQRRENRYCNPLKGGYALRDITSAETYSDLEHLWYKEPKGEQSKKRVEERKGYGHDSSRYMGVNFHSLLGRNGTLEIRYHSGTLDYNKITHWISLHQTIMDKVSGGKIKRSDIQKALVLTSIDKKVEYFMTLLSLSDDMRAYITGRINTYNK